MYYVGGDDKKAATGAGADFKPTFVSCELYLESTVNSSPESNMPKSFVFPFLSVCVSEMCILEKSTLACACVHLILHDNMYIWCCICGGNYKGCPLQPSSTSP